MIRLAFVVSFLVLTGCRVLPPVPRAPSDEAIFSKLEQFPWEKGSDLTSFDKRAVEEVFGEDFFSPEIYRIQPRLQYNQKQPDTTLGIRRFFRFYMADADWITGLSVFVHEAIHAANWIDVFDGAYNEFLSFAAELHLVTLVAPRNPDLAVIILNHAMVFYLERDAHYEPRSHMKARLWLAALLDQQEPLEIYRWAQSASKSEFHSRIQKALGKDSRDVVRRGLTNFVRRHFPQSDYLSTLFAVRDKMDPRVRLEYFEKLTQESNGEGVFADNIQFQIARSLLVLRRFEEVLERSEKVWPKTKGSFLASPLAQIAFEAACVSGDEALRETWRQRVHDRPLWIGNELVWQVNRLRALHENRHLGLINFLTELEKVTQHTYWSMLDLEEPVSKLVEKLILEELKQLNNNWTFNDPPEGAEQTLKKLAYFLNRWPSLELKNLFEQTHQTLLSRRADMAFVIGDLELADQLYKKSKKGRHTNEVRFWLDTRH